jgi:hypothetical protein
MDTERMPAMSDFATEWGVKSPWGLDAAKDRDTAATIVANMRSGGHEASVIWRGVTEWHHEMNDELAMQPAELTKES